MSEDPTLDRVAAVVRAIATMLPRRPGGFVDLADLRSILVENADGPGPHGSKGIGESGLMPTAPAIANAIAQAIGVRLTALPLTPERVWQALRGAQAHQTS